MEKFHITITDNETGETIRDYDINSIIAGIDLGDTVSACVICEGTPSDLAHTAFAAKDAIDLCLEGEHLATKMYKHLLKHNPEERKGE